MSYYYHHLSVLVVFIAIITLTNIAGNPNYQIHAQTDGPIIYQPPTTHPQKSVALNKQRPRHRKLPQGPMRPVAPAIEIPGIPHIPIEP
ncbi:leguminosin proline-rich group669 secreted peptide [Medicago truncatula]|uniref:Leguminosin proline-rich group669 secreted peptide n=1 Tax=Medicago truncatula TaxID=3880 RepID=A0A072V838_MEDTR|nr:leguminosin proline-rich group669 secreted peptide [Medicago truncatula]